MITVTLDNNRIQRGDICILKLDPIPDDSSVDTTLSKPRPCLVLTKNHFGCTVIPLTTSDRYNFGIAIKCEAGTDRLSYPRYDQVVTVVDKKLTFTGVNLLSQFPVIYNKIIDNLASYYKGDSDINIIGQSFYNVAPISQTVKPNSNIINSVVEHKPPLVAIDYAPKPNSANNSADVVLKGIPAQNFIKDGNFSNGITQWSKDNHPDKYNTTNSSNKNSVSKFIDERYTSVEGRTINSVEIYNKYTHYCTANSVNPVGQKTFSLIMNNLGYKKLSLSSKQVYIGIEEKDRMIPVYTPLEEKEQENTEPSEEKKPDCSLNKFIEIHDKYLKENSKSLPKKIRSFEEEKGAEYLKNLLSTNSINTVSIMLNTSLTNISIMRKRYGVFTKTST